MQHLAVAGACQGEEDLVDLLALDLRWQLVNPPDDLAAGKRRPRFQAIVEHTADRVAVFREHRHPVQQQFAAGAGSDDQHPIRSNAAALLHREQTTQEDPSDQDQGQGNDHAVAEHQARIGEAAIDRHQGKRDQPRHGCRADDREHLIEERAATPDSIDATEGKSDDEDEGHAGCGRQVVAKRRWLKPGNRNTVDVESVVVGEDNAHYDRHDVDQRSCPREPAILPHQLRTTDPQRWPAQLRASKTQNSRLRSFFQYGTSTRP